MGAYLDALLWISLLAFAAWLYSLFRRNVNIVDTLWALMFLIVALSIAAFNDGLHDTRVQLILFMVAFWALRLSGFLALRNWGKVEDRRYQVIRAGNQPGFPLKSLYLIFGLQTVLAWLIAVPLVVSMKPGIPMGWIDAVAVILWLTGWLFESISDWQLFRYKQRTTDQSGVLDQGLWRFSRHPNYFGEFCIWWAYYLLALAAAGWWTIYAPLLMSLLLFRVSGVTMMENGVTERRPAYQRYQASTPVFFPYWPRKEEV